MKTTSNLLPLNYRETKTTPGPLIPEMSLVPNDCWQQSWMLENGIGEGEGGREKLEIGKAKRGHDPSAGSGQVVSYPYKAWGEEASAEMALINIGLVLRGAGGVGSRECRAMETAE
jgi:hypothetical protein